jgi:hypothetical protein
MAAARPDHRPSRRAVLSSARSWAERIARAARALHPDQRLAAIGAVALFFTMFLPWYSKNFTGVVSGHAVTTTSHLNAFQAFSWVEAAVLLVSFAVLAMLFNRAEGRRFHLPGGDGVVIFAAGVWSGLLIFYRFFDKQQGNDTIRVTWGVTWGIFFALLAAIMLAYAGTRVHAAHRAEVAQGPRPSDAQGSESFFDPEEDHEYGQDLGAPRRPLERRRPSIEYPPLESDFKAPGEYHPAARRAPEAAGTAVPAPRPREDPKPQPSAPSRAPRPRYPPAPQGPPPATPAGREGRRVFTREEAQQLSFDDAPTERTDDDP